MAGAIRGVVAQIISEEERALLTHCYGHALNLAVSDSVKKCKVVKDAMDARFEISNYLNTLQNVMKLLNAHVTKLFNHLPSHCSTY